THTTSTRGKEAMSNDAIFKEIEQTLGLVPGFFRQVPAETLLGEWTLFKKFTLETKSPLPPKMRELIGIAVASANRCKFCTFFHKALAKFHGATDEEIADAIFLAGMGAHWSTMLHGLNYPYDTFVKE